MKRLLILAGTAEARQIARTIADWEGLNATLSLAGATRYPQRLALPTRIGGFGGSQGFRDYLQTQKIDAVLDVTHPYASEITPRSWAICQAEGIPYLHLLRPPWTASPGDLWTEIQQEEEATDHIHPPATVFLATGRQTLKRFEGLGKCKLICRQIDPPDGPFPFPNGEYLVGRPPFSIEDETDLFRRLAIDWLVVKNAGGAASETKLVAARELGIPVLMIARPPLTDCPRVDTIDGALNWIRELP